MWGDSESASKNTSKPIFKCPKYSNIRIFKNSLASELVFVSVMLNHQLEIVGEEFVTFIAHSSFSRSGVLRLGNRNKEKQENAQFSLCEC